MLFYMEILIFTEPKYDGAKVHGVRYISHLVEESVSPIIRLDDNPLVYNFIGYYRAVAGFLFLPVRILYHRLLRGVLTVYMPLNMTTFGLSKVLVIITVCNLFKTKSRFVLHIHRSDFQFYLGKRIKLFRYILRAHPEFILLSEKHVEDFRFFLQKIDTGPFQLWKLTNPFYFAPLPEVSQNNRFICVANYLKSKGQKALCDIVTKINSLGNNVRLDFYGEILDFDYYQELKSKFECTGFFTFNDSIHGRKKVELLMRSEGFLYASEIEAYPLVVVEASLLCKRLICYNIGYMEDVFYDGFDGLIEYSDIESFCDAIVNDKGYLDGYRKQQEHNIENFNKCITEILS